MYGVIMAQLLMESDNRSKLDKLRDLANHPNTLPHMRDMALKKIEELKNLYPETPKPKQSFVNTNTYTPPASILDKDMITNISERDIHNIYLNASSFYDIYTRFRLLSPKPYAIEFCSGGTINFRVKGPFCVSRQQYHTMIKQLFPTVKSVNIHFQGDNGYVCALSFIA